MENLNNLLVCDGCSLAASPNHTAERIRRLELATQFRPLHISILFIALAPQARLENYFYTPQESKALFDPLMDALEISSASDKSQREAGSQRGDSERLGEFQRRGYFLTYLSECPVRASTEPVAATISRLGPTLIRRVRLNYRPKNIALLGPELFPLIEMFQSAGIGPLLTSHQGSVISVPSTGDREGVGLFRRAVSAASA
jgi:hypothetical protein